MIQHRHIRVHVVNVVGIWRIIFNGPFRWWWNITFKQRIFGLRFIVDTIETNDILQETMYIWMFFRLIRSIEQR